MPLGSQGVSGDAVMAKSTQALPLDSFALGSVVWAQLALPADPDQHLEEGRIHCPFLKTLTVLCMVPVRASFPQFLFLISSGLLLNTVLSRLRNTSSITDSE